MANVRWTLGLCAAALAAAAGPASAFNPQPEPPLGIVGLARTQTAILNAVLTQPPDPQCVGLVATLEIVDLFGATRVLAVSQIAPVPEDGTR